MVSMPGATTERDARVGRKEGRKERVPFLHTYVIASLQHIGHCHLTRDKPKPNLHVCHKTVDSQLPYSCYNCMKHGAQSKLLFPSRSVLTIGRWWWMMIGKLSDDKHRLWWLKFSPWLTRLKVCKGVHFNVVSPGEFYNNASKIRSNTSCCFLSEMNFTLPLFLTSEMLRSSSRVSFPAG